MGNKGIILFLIFLALVIVSMIVVDYTSGRPGRSKVNPFDLNVDEYKFVDPSLINYKETKQFKIDFKSPAAIKVSEDRIFVAGDNKLQIISTSGSLLSELIFEFQPKVLEVYQDKIYLSDKNQVHVYNKQGLLLNHWEPMDANSHISSMAATESNVFVADAGKRKIFRFSETGELLNEFDGKSEEGALHGFIVPSPSFDIDINGENELWVVNPGLHSLENYTFDGRLRGHWKRSGVNVEGFSGCCNPGYFTFLNDGRFVTSEKGLVRIKTYKQSGEFEGVVAAPDKFTDEGRAPGVATDSQNNIYVLDFDSKTIRVFIPKELMVQGKQGYVENAK